MKTIKTELCYYCVNKAEYNDLVPNGNDFIVTGVCKNHIKNYVQGS